MTSPEEPKLPPRKPVELPPIDRTPVADTSNAAYSALTPRVPAAVKPAEAADASSPATQHEEQPSEEIGLHADAEASGRPDEGLRLSRAGLIASVVLTVAAIIVALLGSALATPGAQWPLYLGACVGSIAVLLAVLARRHRGGMLVLVLSALVTLGCIGFAFVAA